MKVKFLKSPTGMYRLAYSAGQETDIKDTKLVDKMVKSGHAEVVEKKPVKKSAKKADK